jgi:hypothetical protein
MGFKMGTFIDLTGSAFGKLIVISRAKNKGKETRWICRCECGNSKEIYGIALKSGHTKSCGCIAKETASNKAKIHGMFGTPEWFVWASMKGRCSNKNHKQYAAYGGRGITVCDEWTSSFQSFFTDMGSRPSQDHQLDRIDNNTGYSKENCRWATRTENQRNRRVTKRFNGYTLKEISDITGHNYNTLKTNLRRGKIDLMNFTP